VDGATVSPDVYRDIIFPSEKKLGDFYGRVFYYHSCGNLTNLLDPLVTLPNLRILHVSSWTSLKKAYEMSGKDTTLQMVLHPEDVLNTTPEKTRKQIKEILDTVPDRPLWICADAIYSGNAEKVKEWVSVCKEVVLKYT
jgi:uroporphyrinogen-III decarboxylase